MLSNRKLKDHEKLILWRRRKNWSQNTAATFLSTNTSYLWQMEHEIRPIDKKILARVEEGFSKPTRYEMCTILRLRTQRSQRDIAEDLNLSTNWVNQMERGLQDATRLFDYWGV